MNVLRNLMTVLVVGFSMAASAGTTVQVSTSFSEAVLADICSGDKIDAEALRESPELKIMLSHFSQFRDYFTMEAYLAARQLAADCVPNPRDIFRFNQVIEERKTLTRALQALDQNQAGLSEEISLMLRPYVPADLSYEGAASIMVGTPSCGGWSSGSSFYLDLPCLRGDEAGMQYLIVHESYHGMQEQFMQNDYPGDLVQRLLNRVIREGSATYVADFRKIAEPGHYASLSQRMLETNDSRVQQNFDLLDISIGYLVNENTEEAFERVNNIGLSGSFDSPFYSVGETVTRAIVDEYGNPGLVCILKAQAKTGFAIYRSLSAKNPELPELGPVMLVWLDSNAADHRIVLARCGL